MNRINTTPVILVALAISTGCRQAPAPSQAIPAGMVLQTPTEITALQRSTTVIPGSDERAQLTIDDITRNQVFTSIVFDQAIVLAPGSMSPGDEASFALGEHGYILRLESLHNALIGDDSAVFVIQSPSEEAPSADAQIERLIAAVASRTDLVFIRNGSEHSAANAADHLTRKWRAKQGEIRSVDEFIDRLASRSSITGKPYLIRLSDNETVEAAAFFRGLNRDLNSQQQ